MIGGIKDWPDCTECQCYPECRNDCPDWVACYERLPVYHNPKTDALVRDIKAGLKPYNWHVLQFDKRRKEEEMRRKRKAFDWPMFWLWLSALAIVVLTFGTIGYSLIVSP